MTLLKRDFFARPTLEVARDLLGKKMVFGPYQGLITETEAYIGEDDPACHAARGLTPRTRIMYGPPGFSYVYLIYGMYFCLNFVTEREGFPAAVLIRGLYLHMPHILLLDGPGKLCRAVGITREHNGVDVTESASFHLEDTHHRPAYTTTPRIGISKATERPWRFLADTGTLV